MHLRLTGELASFKHSAWLHRLHSAHRLLTKLAFVGILITLLSCSSTPKSDPTIAQDTGPHVVGYDLDYQEVIKHSDPQPWQTEVYIVWRFSNGSSKRQLAFIGWDFTRDGRFEMIDRLDVTGSVVEQKFDFQLGTLD